MKRTRIITIGGTLLSAVGIGFIMQHTAPGAADARTPAEQVARSDFKPLSEPVFPGMAEPESGAPGATGADTGLAPEMQLASLSSGSLPDMPKEPAMPQTTCAVDAVATVDAGAMVQVNVSAPCLPNERAVVHHNGMMFTSATDDAGMMSAMIPALSENAVFLIEFNSGDGAVATATVSSLMFYDRVVLQWMGDTGFELHAREYGADYGSDGHVWSGAAREVSAAALGQGGFMTRLGVLDTLAPRIVEVYTFPSGTASRSGDVALSVEAEVTAKNCGQDIEAQSLEVQSDGTLHTQYLTLAVPECDSIGDFLVLNNLVDDLKIAAN